MSVHITLNLAAVSLTVSQFKVQTNDAIVIVDETTWLVDVNEWRQTPRIPKPQTNRLSVIHNIYYIYERIRSY